MSFIKIIDPIRELEVKIKVNLLENIIVNPKVIGGVYNSSKDKFEINKAFYEIKVNEI
jgi:hypothetical protein